MAVSPYFQHVNHPGEQKLSEDLVVEAIQLNGVNVHYIPRETINDDEMFNEAEINKFRDARLIEMFPERISNFNGDGDLFSKFGGFTLTDSATFVVAKRRFVEELGDLFPKPRDGDLIYIDFADQMFEIQKLKEDENWRAFGMNNVFRMELTKFQYGHEDISTGIPNIDDMVSNFEIEELDANLQPTGVTTTDDPRDFRDFVEALPVVDNLLEFGRD